MCRFADLVPPCRPDAVAAGRHFLRGVLRGWGVVVGDAAWAVLDDITLVASELLTNAATACTDHLTLAVEGHYDRVHLDVSDDSPAPAVVRSPPAGSPSGRGLAIVAALSTQWGQTDFDGVTKSVWADVAVPVGSALAQGCAFRANQ